MGSYVHDLKFSCCSMEHEDYYEEVSDNENQIGQQVEEVSIVSPYPIQIP